MRRHKAASAVVIAVVLLLVAFTAAAAVSSSSNAALSDATSCTQWASASAAQQSTYAQLYFAEHGGLASGANDPTSIRSAINSACSQAAYLGESDDVSVLAAVRHNF
jgi:type II secretory pathway pseudopilin PulG